MTDQPDTIGPQLTRLQKQELHDTLKAMLGLRESSEKIHSECVLYDDARTSKVHSVYTEVVDEALEVKLDLMPEYHDDISLANSYLRDEIQELWYQRIDDMIDHGEIPRTEGEAQDVVDSVVEELAEIVHEQAVITSEDIHDYRQRMHDRNERLGLTDDADRLYEARKESLL